MPLEDSDFVAFSPDSRKLITREPQWSWRRKAIESRPSRIQVWDAEDGTWLLTLSDEWTNTGQVIPSQDSHQLMGWTRGEPGKSPDSIKTCDLRSGKTIQQAILPCKHGSMVRLQYSPDRKWVGIMPVSGYVGHFHIWRVGSDELVHFDGIGPRITFSEDGEYLAGSSEGGSEFSVEVWQLNDPSRSWRKRKWSADEGFVFPDCKTAATYHYKNFKVVEANLWDLSTGRLLASFPAIDSGSRIQLLDFPANGTVLTHQIGGASTAIWDVNGQPKLIAILKDWKIAISPDRTWILQCKKNGVDLASLRSGRKLSLKHSSDEPTSSLEAEGQFSPDSRTVAVTGIHPPSIDNSFSRWIRNHLAIRSAGQWQPVTRLWDVETGAEVGVFHGCAHVGVLDGSTKVLFSPDSKTLATLQEDGTIRLWDVPPRPRIWQILGSAVALWLLLCLWAKVWGKLRRENPNR